MEVAIDERLSKAVLSQLVQQNAQSRVLQGVIADYTACLQRCRELQVRNGQLDKEAGELRSENGELHRVVEESKHAAVRSEEYAALEARATQLQSELTAAYKEKALRAEESLQATKQLQVVRDISERQARELAEAAAELRRARDAARDLRAQLEQQREAYAVLAREMEVRLAEAQAATATASRLEADNAELVRRLMELKGAEMERMNEINRMREEMLESAKQQAAQLLAEARSKAAGLSRRGTSSQGGELPPGIEGALHYQGGSAGAAGEEEVLPKAVLKSLPAHEGGCFGLSFDRLGAKMASCGADKTVKLWDAATAAVTSTLHGAFEGLNSVCFTADHKLVLAADSRQAVRVWDVATGRLRSSLTGHVGKVMCVDCSAADPQTVVSCGADRTIKVWGLDKGYCTRTLMCPSTCNSLALSQDGSLVVSGHFDGTLRFWELRSGRLAHEVAGLHSTQITSVAAGLAGDLVLTCGKDNLLRTLDVRTFEVRQTLAAPGFSVGGTWAGACLSPGERFAAAPSADGTVFVWDVEKKAVAGRLRSPKLSSSGVTCAWSPLGAPLVSCDKQGAVTFWHAQG